MARGIDGRLTVLLDKLDFELTNGGFGAEKHTAGGGILSRVATYGCPELSLASKSCPKNMIPRTIIV